MEYYLYFAAIVIYVILSFGIMCYGLHCYVMLFLFLFYHRKNRKKLNEQIQAFDTKNNQDKLPQVTIQLPIYNEAEVVQRLIASSFQLDYPKDRYEVQILDDSTDETVAIVDEMVEKGKELGVNICVVRREKRTDYKAGALAYGMKRTKSEYLAIFDSDFIIPENFLQRTVPLILSNPNVACVQGRWGHVNRTENWLTRAQSVGIDGHFTAEQGARSYSGLCMNFNGTGGLWSKQAIEHAGGWQGDTLTEDLDLSYRAQMQGYRIIYDYDLVCPAEIPNNIIALKSQQKRWAKGSIETSRKLLGKILQSQLTYAQKIEAFFHLTHYMIAILMVGICIVTLPMIISVSKLQIYWIPWFFWFIILLSALAPGAMYTGSGMVQKKGFFSLLHFPAMLLIGTGLCLNNALGVWEALFKKKSDFVRTPKSGSTSDNKQKGRYRATRDFALACAEVILGAYCLGSFTIYLSGYAHTIWAFYHYLFGIFIALYALGLMLFGTITFRSKWAF